jgi:hypothetical protein
MFTCTFLTATLGPIIVALLSGMPAGSEEGESVARNILKRACRIVSTLPAGEIEGSDRDELLRMIAQAQADAGDLEGALRSAEKIELRPEFVSAICEFRAAAREIQFGHPKAARKILNNAYAHVKSNPDNSARVKGRLLAFQAGLEMLLDDEPAAQKSAQEFYHILHKYLKFSRPEAPLESSLYSIEGIWEELGGVPLRVRLSEIGEGRGRYVPVPDGLLRRLALEQLCHGKVKEALETAEQIGDPNIFADALIGIARLRADTEEMKSARIILDRASRAADAVGSPTRRRYLLLSVARAYALANDRAAALTVLEGVEPVEGTWWISEPDYIASYAVALAKVGKPETAGKWLREARRLAEGLADGSDRQRALYHVADAHVDIGEIEAAAQIAKTIGGYNYFVAPRIALERAKRGDLVRAMRSVEDLNTDTEKAEAVRWIAHALSTTDSHSKTLAWAEKQSCPLLQAWALLGFAEGILGKKYDVRPGIPLHVVGCDDEP